MAVVQEVEQVGLCTLSTFLCASVSENVKYYLLVRSYICSNIYNNNKFKQEFMYF